MIEAATDLIVNSIEGSADRGGWQVSGSFANNQEDAEYGRRAEVYVLPEGAATWAPEYKLALEGSILPKTLVFDRRQSNTSIIIATTDVFLANAGLQGIYFSQQDTPTNVHQMVILNLGKIVEHIIEQHTNVSEETAGGWVDTSGIDTLHSTTVDVYTVRQSNSIWQTIAEIAANEFYVRYFTKTDAFIYEPHPQFRTVLPDTTIDITQADLVGQPEIMYRDEVQTDQVQAYALTDDGEILQAFYPANVGTEGRRLRYTNLRCNSQVRLNLLAERAFLFANRDFRVKVTLPGAWGAYLELYDRVSITYTGTDRNGVEIDWDDKKFWIDKITINKQGNFYASTELDLDEENL